MVSLFLNGQEGRFLVEGTGFSVPYIVKPGEPVAFFCKVSGLGWIHLVFWVLLQLYCTVDMSIECLPVDTMAHALLCSSINLE